MPEKPKAYGKKIFSFTNARKIHYDVYIRKPNKLSYGEDCLGICYDPQGKDPHILISPRQSDKSMMNTCIHEVCHAFFWDKSEYDISRFSNAISRLIFGLGWRKIEDINIVARPPEKTRQKKDKK